MSQIYLIKRGPRPAHHREPYHPVVICPRKKIAGWEASWSGDHAWVWTHDRKSPSSGWLLTRWNGLDIDYGHIVRGFELPDGTPAAFVHDPRLEPWTLIDGAVWWDTSLIPEWLAAIGCVYPPDTFSRRRLIESLVIAGTGNAAQSPDFWPPALDPEEQA